MHPQHAVRLFIVVLCCLFFLALPAAPAAPASTPALIFPKFAQGDGYQTMFLLNNLSETEAEVRVEFFTASGQTANVQEVQINGYGVKQLSLSGVDAKVGWARLTTNSLANVLAMETIQFLDGDGLLAGEISVPPAQAASAFRLPVYADDGFSTSIAVVNTGNKSEPITLTLRLADGSIGGTRTMTLAPMQQMAALLSEIIPGLPQSDGTLEIAAPAAVVSLALRQNTFGVFSAIPESTADTTAYFSPDGGISARIVQEIQGAAVSLDVAIYEFTRKEIADALIAARQRGVTVRVIADSSEADTSGTQIARLESAGISVKRTDGGGGGIMHNKYAIFDEGLLFAGSYNWSTAAEEDNDENAVFLRDAALIAAYQANFNTIWARKD